MRKGIFHEVMQRAWRRLELLPSLNSWFRLLIYSFRGAKIGRGTRLAPRMQFTWPHQLQLGDQCILQSDIFFNYDHFWTPGPSIFFGDRVFIGRGCEFNIRSRLEIGDDCLIASGCIIIDHDHGRESNVPMNSQEALVRPVIIGRNVWLGVRCVILKGVTIGDNAVIAAGSVVTKSIPTGQIWAGVPARPLTGVASSSEKYS